MITYLTIFWSIYFISNIIIYILTLLKNPIRLVTIDITFIVFLFGMLVFLYILIESAENEIIVLNERLAVEKFVLSK